MCLEGNKVSVSTLSVGCCCFHLVRALCRVSTPSGSIPPTRYFLKPFFKGVGSSRIQRWYWTEVRRTKIWMFQSQRRIKSMDWWHAFLEAGSSKTGHCPSKMNVGSSFSCTGCQSFVSRFPMFCVFCGTAAKESIFRSAPYAEIGKWFRNFCLQSSSEPLFPCFRFERAVQAEYGFPHAVLGFSEVRFHLQFDCLYNALQAARRPFPGISMKQRPFGLNV